MQRWCLEQAIDIAINSRTRVPGISRNAISKALKKRRDHLI